MKRRFWITTPALALLLAPLGTAQDVAGVNSDVDTVDYNDVDNDIDYRAVPREGEWFGPTEGDWEMTLAGSGSSDKDFETGGFNISVDASTYLTDLWNVGVRQDVGYSDTTTTNDWTGSTSVFTQLHFGEERLRPFVGVGVGYLYGDNVDDTFFAGPEAGVKYYVKPEAFIFARATYQFLFDDTDEIDSSIDDGRFLYTLGLGFTF
jgi:hypothetical protein